MMDKNAEEGRAAAKQDLTELLIDILIPPFKSELSTILDQTLFPFEKEISQKQERLQTQSTKIARIITKHYPDNSPPLDEQIQALLDAQQDATRLAEAVKVDLVVVLDEQSKQSQYVKAEILGLSEGVRTAVTSFATTRDQLNQLSEVARKSLGQLTQLASAAQVQHLTHQEILEAVAGLDVAIGGKLDEHLQELLMHGQSMLDTGALRFREGMTKILMQLHAAQASRAVILEVVQGLSEASHRNLSQLSRQLQASIENQRLAKTEALHAIETLGIGSHTRMDEHQAELIARLQSASQSGEEHLDQELSALFENLRSLEKEGVRRLERLIVVTANQTRADLKTAMLEQGERLHYLVTEQGRMLQADNSACIQSLVELRLGLRQQQAHSEGQKSEQDASLRQLKQLLFGFAVMIIATLGVSIYLVVQSH